MSDDEQLRSTIYEQSISPVDDTMAEDLIVSRRCSSLSQLDDVGAGKLREMLALHSNRHAVHVRFTLTD